MTTGLTGGCACGRIRYRVTAEPLFGVICYCRECQRSTGTAASPLLAVPRAAFRYEAGEPRSREYTADSGNRARHFFCGECGAQIAGISDGYPDTVTLRLGSLDTPVDFQPAMQVYVANAPAWLPLPESGQRFQRLPDGPPA